MSRTPLALALASAGGLLAWSAFTGRQPSQVFASRPGEAPPPDPTLALPASNPRPTSDRGVAAPADNPADTDQGPVATGSPDPEPDIDTAPPQTLVGGRTGQTGANQRIQVGIPAKTRNVWTELRTRFGSRTLYGGWGAWADKAHGATSCHQGARALDIAPINKSAGDAIAAYCVANSARLDIQRVIWYRRQWTRARGWHPYSGRSPHTDHVHLSIGCAR